MNTFLLFFSIPVMSALLMLIFTPALRRMAIRLNHVDKPNARKVHQQPVPLIGGIAIFSVAMLSLAAGLPVIGEMSGLSPILSGAALLLLVGIVDDRVDVRASYKLVLQLMLSYYVFASGIRIDSMFGILGVHALPLPAQYFLTMVVITGTVNAFNLTDGIDGLAAGLALIGFTAYTVIAVMLGNHTLALLFLAFAGGLMGFLRFNLSQRQKIFMGDAGSLTLGYILVVSGLMLIRQAEGSSHIAFTLATVIGVLGIPVADSLRVYRNRVKAGKSPFKADKTHLHHLVLEFGVKHRTATGIILLLALGLLMLCIFSSTYLPLTLVIVTLLLLFSFCARFLEINHQLLDWKQKLEMMEKREG